MVHNVGVVVGRVHACGGNRIAKVLSASWEGSRAPSHNCNPRRALAVYTPAAAINVARRVSKQPTVALSRCRGFDIDIVVQRKATQRQAVSKLLPSQSVGVAACAYCHHLRSRRNRNVFHSSVHMQLPYCKSPPKAVRTGVYHTPCTLPYMPHTPLHSPRLSATAA